jgi:S-adenosylmethionine:tRNA ribosyltransferase-isomerase
MYSEQFYISLEASEIINKTLRNKKSVIAVGSSVARAIEASVLTSGAIKPNKGWTDKFIYPPYDFKIVSKLITNFHPPESCSLLLSAAFAGKETLFKAYKRAQKTITTFLPMAMQFCTSKSKNVTVKFFENRITFFWGNFRRQTHGARDLPFVF